MNTSLDQLKQFSTVVADTADIAAIKRLRPVDATTNPSLVLQQAKNPEVSALIEQARAEIDGSPHSIKAASMRLACQLGAAIAEFIPGYVSTEVDARLSFDTNAQVDAGRRIIETYDQLGVERGRILIKLAATWEGIEACQQLESEGIGCNLTLVFSEVQAIRAANAGATLISPFVGRIYDWHVARGNAPETAEDDPGVDSVRRIYRLYKAAGVETIVMGASFRTADQVMALAGCDRLTISPKLLDELDSRTDRVISMAIPEGTPQPLPTLSHSEFMLQLAQDPMATEKLADGISRFVADQEALEALISGQ